MPHVSRRSTRASLLGVAAAIACATSTPLARAGAEQAAIEPIRIEYTGSRACPTYDEFVANVRRYTTKWRAVEQDPAGRTFRVVLTPRGSSSSTAGKLESVDPSSFAREIVGPDCGAVARALAIALAVMIDPEANLSGSAAEPPPEEIAEAEDIEPLQRPVDQPDRARAARPREAERTHRATVTKPKPRIAIEGSFSLTSTIVAGLVPVIGATVELDPFPDGLFGGSRWLRPSIALGVRQSMPREIERSGMISEFLWTAGALRVCPARWAAFRDRLELVPCFEMNAGSLRADVSGSRDSRSSARFWLDFGGSAHLKWQVHGPWFIGAMFAVAAPITRYRFELATTASVSQAPSIGIAFGPTAGLRF